MTIWTQCDHVKVGSGSDKSTENDHLNLQLPPALQTFVVSSSQGLWV